MRLLLVLLFLVPNLVNCHHHLKRHHSKHELNDPRNLYFLDEPVSNHSNPGRQLIGPGDPPRTSQEMMSVFSQVFLSFLSTKHRGAWERLMQLTRENAHIETCMVPTYSLSHIQFEKWMMFLGNRYTQVASTSNEMKLDSTDSVTFEVHYSTDVKGKKGSDKWSFTASMDKSKGHFMVHTMYMITDCKPIPTYPPLEPAVNEEGFMANLRNKLMSDLFLNGAIRYKISYDSMYDYLTDSADISACDIGKLDTKQFVEYWFKRYGKVTKYKDHVYNAVKKEDGSHHIDFAFTYEGESPNTFFRDSYQILVKKVINAKVTFYENIQDWSIVQIHQSCTDNLTPMGKYDEAQVRLALHTRRFEQLFTNEVRWNAVAAFEGMFDYSHNFNGYHCTDVRFNSLADLDNWMKVTPPKFKRPSVLKSEIHKYENNDIGFWVDFQMTRIDGSTTSWRVHFEGFMGDNGHWRFNHLGISCDF